MALQLLTVGGFWASKALPNWQQVQPIRSSHLLCDLSYVKVAYLF